jgi:hypothetical protein
MFWISGVWDPRMKHRLIGFFGIMSLLLVAYVGALVSGEPFILRLIF